MYLLVLSYVFASLVHLVYGRDPRYAGPEIAARLNSGEYLRNIKQTVQRNIENAPPVPKQVVQNNVTAKFIVDGKKIPEVNFDVGESYAGSIPIGSSNNTSLFFWYFPTTNPDGKNDLTIWLNGGPGCSSLEGFLQENGPFLWNYGTFKPVKNPWSFQRLSNTLWVEQPVGTGFSHGDATEYSEEMIATSFLAWFKNFMDTFELHGKKIYIAGESYAGLYIPYIADAMFNKKDKKYFDLRGTMIYDGSINTDAIMSAAPTYGYVKAYDNIFQLNDTFMAEVEQTAKTCGYIDYVEKYLTYPPKGKLPQPTLPTSFADRRKCKSLWGRILDAVSAVNPCFNYYQITTSCPLLWDVLGFPGSFEYLPEGASVYFDRADVKKAINAPTNIKWEECSTIPLSIADMSEPSSWSVLPRVIERSERTILGHGGLDYVLLANGTLLSIQNMTWNGAQGFQKPVKSDFFVPYHDEESQSTMSGSGVQGVTHTERGLTYVEVFMSGHMIPQYAPSSAYRHLEFLLGRIESLSERTGFTTQRHIPQPRDRKIL
ncbi:alpha/beta-hydrolase [Microthyrium microscopicum]|uniref:Carboxypeptidase n=1 Tax=Microthyrium microscopicum TaxID=703497 RepID=A0A6A6URZ8_9PEZI|nr:alpha/beta-hydrolase [Microthyrium microscopicum]